MGFWRNDFGTEVFAGCLVKCLGMRGEVIERCWVVGVEGTWWTGRSSGVKLLRGWTLVGGFLVEQVSPTTKNNTNLGKVGVRVSAGGCRRAEG